MAMDILDEVLIVAQFRPLGPAGSMGPGGAWAWSLAGDCAPWLMENEEWSLARNRFAKAVPFLHGVAVEDALSIMMQKCCDSARAHGIHPILAKIEASGGMGMRRLLASVAYRHFDGNEPAAARASQGLFGQSFKGVGRWTPVDMAPPNDERLRAKIAAIKEGAAIQACAGDATATRASKSI